MLQNCLWQKKYSIFFFHCLYLELLEKNHFQQNLHIEPQIHLASSEFSVVVG